MDPLVIGDFTSGAPEGTGAFDVMMQTVKDHVGGEYTAGRIKGTEYATVYLGALQSTMDRALQFLLQKDKASLEAELIAAQVSKVQAEILKVNAEVLLVEAQTALAVQQKLNAVKEFDVLEAQKCKLQAEFDVLMETKLKVIAETGLLAQKKITEQAQTSAAGVDADSVIGKQKTLYERQADGFTRNAEHAVAKLMVDTWNVRRTTDEGTIASATNKLDDVYIGQAVTKLLAGVGA